MRFASASLLVAGLGLLAACARPELPASTAPDPAASFRSEAEAGRAAEEGEWRGWFERLAALDAEDQATEPVYLRAGSERVVWDDAIAGELLDPEPPGPLPTILSLARQLRRAGVDLLVVPVPPRSAVFPEVARLPPGVASPLDGSPGDRPALAWPPLDWRLRLLYARLAAEGVEVVDLLGPLRAQRSGTVEVESEPPLVQRVFRRQDRHWTPYGAGVAATELSRRIREYPWFDGMRDTEGRALLVEQRFVQPARGPIAHRLSEAGVLGPGWPPEPVAVRRVRVRGEQWSQTDRDSPVLLLGDSFALAAHGLPDALLAELEFRLDVLTVAGGVPSAQLKALRFRGDGLQGKRLVIWEFATASLPLTDLWEPVEGIVE